MLRGAVMISVAHPSLAVVDATVRKWLGVAPDLADLSTAGLRIEIEDIAEGVALVENVLAAAGAAHESLMWVKYDSREFGMCVSFEPIGAYRGAYPAVFATTLARHLSEVLKVRVAVSIRDGDVPLVMYDSGRLIDDFSAGAQSCFVGEDWIPRFER